MKTLNTEDNNNKKKNKKSIANTVTTESTTPIHFICAIINEDLKANKNNGRVHTRFPPEPNGYLHIGHAKSIYLNFGLAAEYGGLCNLRFDDTNPSKEEVEYVESIKSDVRWLGFDWEDREYYASDYFEQLYQYAVQLIKDGKAYICSLNAQEIREYSTIITGNILIIFIFSPASDIFYFSCTIFFRLFKKLLLFSLG